jgi:hypothetical protein
MTLMRAAFPMRRSPRRLASKSRSSAPGLTRTTTFRVVVELEGDTRLVKAVMHPDSGV